MSTTTDNLQRIKQGKIDIITSLQNKGVDIPSGILISEIAPYIESIEIGDVEELNRLLSQIAELEAEKTRLEGEIEYLSQNNSSLSSQITSLQSQLNDVNNQLAVLNNQVNELVRDKTNLSEEVQTLTNTNINLQKENEELREQINSGGGSVEPTYNYNELHFTNLLEIDNKLTIADRVDISIIEYSFNNITFEPLETREVIIPKFSTVFLRWNGDINLDKGQQNAMFNFEGQVSVAGILKEEFDSAYDGLFNGTSTITDVSNLQIVAKRLGNKALGSAFRETCITTTPIIKSTKFGECCFDACYMSCGMLQTARKLKVEEYANDSFLFIYRECYYLHHIEIEVDEWDETAFREWLHMPTSEGIIYTNCTNIPTNSTSGVPSGWKLNESYAQTDTPETTDELVEHNKDTSDWDYIKFTSVYGRNDTIITNKSLTYVDRFEYSIDGGNTYYYANSDNIPLNGMVGTIIRWEGKLNQPYLTESHNYNQIFYIENESHNILGELKHGNEPYNYACMFKGDCWLSDASGLRLTADTVGDSAYELMFRECGNLRQPPSIEATTIGDRGCCEMFACTNLYSMPTLPATTVGNYGYFSMFADTVSDYLTTAPELPATNLGDSCYLRMFQNCTSIINAPTVLPATQLTIGCYGDMFYGCSSLTTAPELPATELTFWCYTNMFYGCSSLTTAPELPATELVSACYDNMFNGCTNLNYVKHHVVNWDSSNTYNWLEGVANEGTVECPANSRIPSNNSSGVPNGWTRVDIQ